MRVFVAEVMPGDVLGGDLVLRVKYVEATDSTLIQLSSNRWLDLKTGTPVEVESAQSRGRTG